MRLALHPPTATTETQRRPAPHRARPRPNTADQTEIPAYFRSPEARRSAIDITHHSVGRSVAPREVSRVRQQLKQGRRDRAPDLCNITVHDDPAAQRACATLGAVAFARGSRIYLGGAIGQHGFPGQTHVLRHELLHVAQSRIGQRSHTLHRRSRIEAQAEHFARHGRLEGPLLAADPNEIYGIWPLVVAGLAAAYVLLRPNVANAPGPGDATLPSVSPGRWRSTPGPSDGPRSPPSSSSRSCSTPSPPATSPSRSSPQQGCRACAPRRKASS